MTDTVDTVWQQRSKSFGTAAQEYDRVRPSYPPQLIEDVLELARPQRMLDVGAGTGKATRAFARPGLAITALEPDPRMAEVLKENVAGLDVTVQVGRFEEFEPAQPYDLLICAQAWHWVDEARRWDLGAAALTTGGTIALFWNQDRPADPAVAAELKAIHEEHGADFWYEDSPLDEYTMRWPELADQPAFTDYQTRLYRWERLLSVEDYLANLGTQSSYLILGADARTALFGDIRARLQGDIAVALDTGLHLANRR